MDATTIFIYLIAIVIILFIISRLISSQSLERWANISTVITFIAGIVFYFFPELAQSSQNSVSLQSTATPTPNVVFIDGEDFDPDPNYGQIWQLLHDAQDALIYARRTGDTSNLGIYFAYGAQAFYEEQIGSLNISENCYLEVKPKDDIQFSNLDELDDGKSKVEVYISETWVRHCGGILETVVDGYYFEYYMVERLNGTWYITNLVPPN